jgi:hypothetical protein
MRDFELSDAKSCGDSHRTHKRVQRPNRYEGLDNFAPKCLESAASVVQAVSKNPGPERIGEARHRETKPRVLPVCAHSGDHIEVAQNSEQSRDIGGIILTVPIKSDQDIASRLFHTQKKSSGLTIVEARMKGSRFGPVFRRFKEPSFGAIGASIIDKDCLIRVTK